MSTGGSNAAFNVISESLQSRNAGLEQRSEPLQTVQAKAIKGEQDVKNFIPGLEDLRFLG